jgi:D-alanine-D-alanine ligase
MGKLRVGVIYGGRSGEHEVSLMSAQSVLGALDRSRYDVTEIGITLEGRWIAGEGVMKTLQKRGAEPKRAAMLAEPGSPRIWEVLPDGNEAELHLRMFREVDVIFPVLHGTFGEDGTLQGLLEMAEVPYVGAGVLASSVAMDKALFKQLMRAHGIPLAEYVLCTRREIAHDLDGVVRRAEAVASYPLFTKPANHRPQSSVPGEVVPSREFYSYESKYIDGTSQLLIPAPIPEDKVREVQRMAVEAYRAIDGAGLARADFLMDRKSGELFVNELNTMPGFTTISMYPKLWENTGLPYPELLDRLIELAMERHADRTKSERSYRKN